MSFQVPNTTPVPNEIINGWAKHLNGSELKVVLVVTRVTLGWILDKKSGMRKIEDWLTYKQLMEKTGLTSAPLAKAIDTLVNTHKLIEIRDENGNILKNKKERQEVGRKGGKLYYRLNIQTLEETSSYFRKQSSATLESKVVATLESKDNKNNNITKTTVTKHKCDECPEILSYWNEKRGTKYKSASSFESNLSYWLETYSVEEIKKAIDNIQHDDFWKDKMTPAIFFRKMNPRRENVDYIGDFLNVKGKGSLKKFEAQSDNLDEKYAKYSK